MRIEPLGDSALLIRVLEEFHPEESLDAVLRAIEALEAAAIPGVIESVPAYTTIGVFCDPIRSGGFDELRARIEGALKGASRQTQRSCEAIIEVPLSYEGEFGPELDEVARHAELK